MFFHIGNSQYETAKRFFLFFRNICSFIVYLVKSSKKYKENNSLRAFKL